MPVSTSNGETSLNSLPFKISPKKLKYVGIWITDKHRDLYAANYQPLLPNLNQDIKHWDPLPLSLGGRINTVKMNILAKFLFIFQCLPVFLTKSFFYQIKQSDIKFHLEQKNNPDKEKCTSETSLNGRDGTPKFFVLLLGS